MRNSRLRRRFAILAAAALVAGLGLAPGSPTEAADAKPAKKDSRPQTRPKEATFTTAITPAQAKPGDVVTYKVTAQVEAPWHIYKYAKDQPENGPRYTNFDFFDPAGLTVEGDWAASRAAIKKKEPAFPEIPFLEYHEDEVTWSIKLKVPAKASPGKKVLRCQASYMICSDQNCSFPGQWTLPDAEVTILPSGSGGRGWSGPYAASLLVALQEPPPAPSGPRPAVEDSRRAPKDAAFTAEIIPAEARAGDTVQLKVTARINAPWHIYKAAKEVPESGPSLTTFDLFDPGGLAVKGNWTPSREPVRRKDNAWKDLEFLEFYEGEVSWSLPLEIPAGTIPGKKAARVQVGFMICTDERCSPHAHVTPPPAEFTVLPGGAVAAVVAPSQTPAPPPASPARATTPAGSAADGSADPKAGGVGQEGIIPFLLFCAGGGLFALAMPCVWPMIPVTVNFFVKQGQKNNGSTTGLAIAYSLSIVLTFMAVGLLFSIFFGAASLSKLANNPWLNFGIAGLFLVFGLSLLGLFELRLPNFLLNASARGESRGGFVGVMFMALTLTITSFTCTFPVVGLLLVMASKGYLFYPVIGLATFASVLAFPFLLLSLSPGLLAKMPKSGDWMNTVKVVGGLIEIGAAFKFLNTAECVFVVPADAWTNAYAVLTIWVVLALICGIYLLGLFRTDHDHGEGKVGPVRMIGGWAFLSLALFLAPALFGRPPQSKIWYLVVGLLPADAGDLKAASGGGGGGGGEGKVASASSTDPKQAEREETTFHGVSWGMSYEAALEQAKLAKKPVLIDFTGVNCANCRLMEQEVLPRPDVVQVLGEFVTVQLYTDIVPIRSLDPKDRRKLGDANLKREETLFDDVANPNYVILDAEGKVIGKTGGKQPPEVFIAFMKDALKRFKGVGKVAQGGG